MTDVPTSRKDFQTAVQGQHVIVADIDHRLAAHRFSYMADNFDTYILGQNITDIALEFPPQYQPAIDDYMDGSASLGDLSKAIEGFWSQGLEDLFVKSRAAGLRMHAIDSSAEVFYTKAWTPSSPPDALDEVIAFIRKILPDNTSDSDLGDYIRYKIRMDALISGDIDTARHLMDMYGTRLANHMPERLTNDQLWMDTMIARGVDPATANIMVYAGAAHTTVHVRGIDEILGEYGAVHVDALIFERERNWMDSHLKSLSNPDVPDRVIVMPALSTP